MKCINRLQRRLVPVFLLVFLSPVCRMTFAVNNVWIGPNLGNWNIDANWNIGTNNFVPDQAFDEAALINNGATVILNQPAMNGDSNGDVAGIKIGIAGVNPPGDIETGGLRIESGGVLRSVRPPGGTENGAITVGASTGRGTLTILGNGNLSGTSLVLNGANDSSITLSDTASLSLNGTVGLHRTTTIIGPAVNFNVAGDLTLGITSTLIADIRASTHSPLRTNGNASVNGTLRPLFTGVTPSLGNRWTLIDAATSINGTFADLDLSAAPGLPAGQTYQIINGAIGMRELLQLTIAEDSLLGDYNQNGQVDAADYVVWRKTLNQTGTGLAADGNGDGMIDLGDYGVWRTHFGTTRASASGAILAPVPESTSVLSWLFALAPALAFRMRNAVP